MFLGSSSVSFAFVTSLFILVSLNATNHAPFSILPDVFLISFISRSPFVLSNLLASVLLHHRIPKLSKKFVPIRSSPKFCVHIASTPYTYTYFHCASTLSYYLNVVGFIDFISTWLIIYTTQLSKLVHLVGRIVIDLDALHTHF